jgi:hypothetical protein
MMKVAGVLIDSYKLPIFKKHLDAAGYTYTENAGVTAETLTLRVNFEWVAKLKPVIEAAEAEAKKGARND